MDPKAAMIIRLWQSEVDAIAAYREAYRRTHNPLFLHIAKQEIHHKEELEKLLRQLGVRMR